MRVTNTIKIDFTSPGIPPKITAVAGDINSRQLHVLLFDGGAAFQAPANASAVVRYRRSDGHGGAYDTLPDGSTAITWNDNRSEMDVVLAPAVAAAPGGIILDVLISTPDTQLATFAVLLEILRNPSIGTEPDPDDYYKITSFAGFTQALERMLPKAGGTMSGDLGLDGNKLYFGQSVWAYESEQGVLRLEGDGTAPVLRGIDDPVENSDVVTLGYFNAHKGSSTGGGSGQISRPFVLALQSILRDAHFTTDRSEDITNLINYVNGGEEGGGDDPAPQITLSAISAVYNGTGEDANTDVSTIDITVTAHWSDGSTTILESGYTVSGNIAAGTDNILTVSYEGKTGTVIVAGNAADDIEAQEPLYHFEDFSKSDLNSVAELIVRSSNNSFVFDGHGYGSAYAGISNAASAKVGNLNGGAGLKGGEKWFTIPSGAQVELWLADITHSTFDESKNYGSLGLFDNDDTSNWAGSPIAGLSFTVYGKTSIASMLAAEHLVYTATKDINVRCFGIRFNNAAYFQQLAASVRMIVNGVRWI